MEGDATRFWIPRGEMGKTVDAVVPNARDSRWERWARRCLQSWAVDRARRHLGQRWRRVVDLGCGFGDFTTRFAAHADEVVGCDVSPGFVETARERLHATGHDAFEIACCDLRQFTDFRDVDLAYLGAVMVLMEDADCLTVLRTIRERIRPTGILLSRDWCAVHLGRRQRNTNNWFSIHRRPSDYVALAERAGFRVVEQTPSWAIYGECMAPARWLRWPVQLPWRLASLAVVRASVSFAMRPA